MNVMNAGRRFVAVAASVLLVAACGNAATTQAPAGTPAAQSTEPGTQAPSAASGPLKIGFIGPMTGEYGVWGEDHLAAAQLAADEWNEKGGVLGQQIELVVGDSQGDGAQAAAIANRFVDEGIKAVIGPTFSLEAETSVPIFGPAKVISVTGLADLLNPDGTPGYFRTTLREDNSSKFAARLMTDYLKATKIAIIDDGKSDTVRTAKLLSEFLTEAGVKPIFEGSVTAGQQNYAPTLTQINALAPDVVFLATVNPESALLRKQAQELGMTAKFVLAAGSVEDTFKEIAGELGVPSWSYNATRVEDRFQDFATRFEAKNGRAPGNYNDYTYDAASILFQAISDAGSVEYDQVDAALKAIKEFPGVTGPITFDNTGSRGSEEYAVQEYKPDLTWQNIDVGFSTP
jgi:branched-chain amino acid transport system substrate-binding protein